MEKTLDVNERSFSSLISRPRFRSIRSVSKTLLPNVVQGALSSSRLNRSVVFAVRTATYDSEGLITDVHANAHRTLIYPKQTLRPFFIQRINSGNYQPTVPLKNFQIIEVFIVHKYCRGGYINGHEWAS